MEEEQQVGVLTRTIEYLQANDYHEDGIEGELAKELRHMLESLGSAIEYEVYAIDAHDPQGVGRMLATFWSKDDALMCREALEKAYSGSTVVRMEVWADGEIVEGNSDIKAALNPRSVRAWLADRLKNAPNEPLGYRGKSCRCPLATYLEDSGFFNVRVHSHSLNWGTHEDPREAKLPSIFRDFIVLLDAGYHGEAVYPSEFLRLLNRVTERATA